MPSHSSTRTTASDLAGALVSIASPRAAVAAQLRASLVLARIESAYEALGDVSSDPTVDRHVLIEIAMAEAHLRRARKLAEGDRS